MNYGRPSEYSLHDRLLVYFSIALTNILPVVLVIVSTCGTLAYLVRARTVSACSGRGPRWQGMVTVVITSTVFCVSIIPDTVSFVVVTCMRISSDEFKGVLRVSEFLTALNVMANFYIYSLTIPSFRKFVKTGISRLLLRDLWSCKTLQVEHPAQTPENILSARPELHASSSL